MNSKRLEFIVSDFLESIIGWFNENTEWANTWWGRFVRIPAYALFYSVMIIVVMAIFTTHLIYMMIRFIFGRWE